MMSFLIIQHGACGGSFQSNSNCNNLMYYVTRTRVIWKVSRLSDEVYFAFEMVPVCCLVLRDGTDGAGWRLTSA